MSRADRARRPGRSLAGLARNLMSTELVLGIVLLIGFHADATPVDGCLPPRQRWLPCCSGAVRRETDRATGVRRAQPSKALRSWRALPAIVRNGGEPPHLRLGGGDL